MLNRVQQTLTLPSFEDEETVRVARLVRGMLIAGTCLNVIDAFLLGIFAPETLSTFWLNGALVIVTVVGFILLRRGQVRAASVVLCLSLWVLLSIYFAISGGVTSPAFGFMNLVVIVSAVLLDVQGTVIFGILCIATTIVLYLAGANGLLALTETMPSDERLFATQTTTLLSLAVLMGIGARSVRDALARSRTSERTLAEHNQDLEREIAERKRIEERLLESEEELRQLSDAALEGIVITDQGKIILANRRIAQMLGYDYAELIGKNVLEFVAPESRDLVLQQIQSRHGEPYHHVAIRKDGSRFPVEVLGRMMTYQGKTVRVTALRDITERTRAEEAIFASEGRLRQAMNIAHLGVWDWDIASDKTTWYGEIFKMYGITPEEFTGKGEDYLNYTHPDDRQAQRDNIQQAFEQAAKTGSASGTAAMDPKEFRIIRPDGTERIVIGDAVAIVNQDGKPLRMVGTLLDITERKEIDAALRRSEERFSKAFHSNPGALTINTIDDGRFIDVNESFLKLFGYTREEVIGATSIELQTWADPDDRTKLIKLIREHGRAQQLETRIRKKSGDTGDVLYSVETIELDGETHLLFMLQDITERKQAEERFYKAFHANPSPISISTIQEGRFVDVNESFLKFTGYGRDEILGKTALELRFWETSEERIEALRTLETDGMIRQMPAQLLAKSGEMRYGSTAMELIEIAGEAHLLSMIQDFTDLKLAEQQALDLALAAERAENLKEFLSTISHDLKTPLSVMNTSLYMLERLDDPEKQRDKINTIKKQAELLEKYIQDILTMTRLDHTPVLVRQPVNLNRLLRDIEQRLRPSLEQKNLTTLMDLNQDILPVLGDENELDRVMVNLFENAVNYTPNNGSVTVRTTTQGSTTVTEIVDSGIGIPESDLSRIFDRFYRASEAQRASARGTGLGLAIVKKIVDLHAGSIEVESEVGKGSTFRVSLPVDTRGIDG